MGNSPQGLQLDRVVLLGRTLEEYRRYFALDLDSWRGRRVLDVASGVSSFCAEANAAGLDVTACDPIYARTPESLRPQCAADLDLVVAGVSGKHTYRWDFYRTPEGMRAFRESACRGFLADFAAHPARYVVGQLPALPFADGAFDLALVSYLLFAYERQFDYDFHRRAVLELMRVTRGEARLYPVVSFEAQRSEYIARFPEDPALAHLRFDVVPTDFEFLVNSNFYLRVTHREPTGA
jgi:hypothetical protein